MKEIKINAKSAPVMKQIASKVDAGFKNIEIQLLHEFVNENEYEDTKLAIENMGVNINVVHTPVIKLNNWGLIDISLNYLLNDECYQIFIDTCKYAQYISELENHRIDVVIHNNYSKYIWEESELLEKKIAPKIKDTLDKFFNVDLLIENSSNYGGNNGRFKTIRDMDDVAYSVKELNKVIENKARTLMDTCHMMMNWEVWKNISNSKEYFSDWDTEFKSAVQYSPLGLIHLNSMRYNGLGKNHGVEFDVNSKEDMEKLKSIMDAYEKYTNCAITIEVREDNYEDIPKNLIITKEALEKLGYNVVTEL